MHARFTLLACLVLAMPVPAADAAQSVASTSSSANRPAVTHDLSQVDRPLQHDQVELKRLEHQVAKQEFDSRKADRRLRRQDRAIAELQRQLDQLQPNQPGAGQH